MAKKKISSSEFQSSPTPRRVIAPTGIASRSLQSSTLGNAIGAIDVDENFEETVAERAKRRRQSMPDQVYAIAVANTSQTTAPEIPAKKRKIEAISREDRENEIAALKQSINEQIIQAGNTVRLFNQKMQELTGEPTSPPPSDSRKPTYLQSVSKAMHKRWDEKFKMYAPEPETINLSSSVPAPWRHLQFENFAKSVIADLQQRIPHHPACLGLDNMKRVLGLLLKAKPANDEEGPWLSSDAARTAVESRKFHDGPIFLENQQSAPLMSVIQFLDESVTSKGEVWRQDPSEKDGATATSQIAAFDMRDRFYNPRKPGPIHPWNCLELACPYEDGTRPPFLNSRECRLLSKLKHPNAGRQNGNTKHNEPEKWALLAEAGALTVPHQDSHGYETYLTVNEGTVGFGWLMRPTEAQRRAWVSRPESFNQGEWRYVVLLPGQTVYFPTGTIHFVFRHPAAGHSLIFGGHVLRFSLAHRWFKFIMQERVNPYITNEELTEAVKGYAATMQQFILQNDSATPRTWHTDKIAGLLCELHEEVVGGRWDYFNE